MNKRIDLSTIATPELEAECQRIEDSADLMLRLIDLIYLCDDGERLPS